jgi:hypothetical protein
MKLRIYVLLVFLLVPILAACSSGTAPATQQPAVQQPGGQQAAIPTAEPNNSTVTGTVVGTSTNQPITRTPVYLAQIVWDTDHKEAAFVLNISNSPAAQTDENGFFVFSKVQPAEYAIIVGDYYGRNDVLRESNGNARIFQPQAGQIFEIGKIEMPADVQVKK